MSYSYLEKRSLFPIYVRFRLRLIYDTSSNCSWADFHFSVLLGVGDWFNQCVPSKDSQPENERQSKGHHCQ